MSTWIPILTGLLAFFGAIAGYFVAFNLNATAKRREVRRAQVERLAELVSEDASWLDEYRNEAMFGEWTSKPGSTPHDKAYAIYALYFMDELQPWMKELIWARQEFQNAIGNGHLARLKLAEANNEALSKIAPPKDIVDILLEKHSAYYQATLQFLLAASRIAQETIPEKSHLVLWFADCWTQLSGRFVRRK